MKRYLPHGCVLLSGILWGLIGLFNRNLGALGVSVTGIVLVRNVGGAIVTGLVFLLTDRSVFRISLRHLPIFVGTGLISILLFTLCYFTCQTMCSLAVAGALLYTSPAFVVILSAILWKEKITKKKLAALLAAVLGCTFVTGIWSGEVHVTLLGAALGVASGLLYGLYSIFGRYALAHYETRTVTFYTFALAAVGSLCVLPVAPLRLCFSAAEPALLSLGLIVICTVLPYLLYTKGLEGLDSGRASILASIEPVTAALVGVVVFGEPMGISTVLGLLGILSAVYLLR